MNEDYFSKIEQILSMSDSRLWTFKQIAWYLCIDETTVRDKISKQPNFPQAIRIKYDDKSMRPRFDPKDVKKWALGFKEKRAA